MIFLPRSINPVAYFCVEYGIDNELPTYAGGLGILAGEVISAAADTDFPMIGIGLLHKGRLFVQQLGEDGYQIDADSTFDPNTSFLRETSKKGKPLIIEIPFGDIIIKVRSYYIRLANHTILFFLSPNVDGNPEDWRGLLNTIYWGDEHSQIKQNLLLGVGGVKLLEELGIVPSFYHVNEGRAAFVVLERLKILTEVKKYSFDKAWEFAKDSIVYTNHTLVKAGNVNYSPDLIRDYINLVKYNSNIDTDFLVGQGIEAESNRFDMTRFALNSSHKASAVSKVHGNLSRKLWPEYDWKTITNGVHLPRWQTHAFRNPSISDQDLWNNHERKKRDLARMVSDRTGFSYNPETLVVTWARRIANYKQPRVIFTDIERLAKILKHKGRPVQLIYAGKAHPGDPENKEKIKEIVGYSRGILNGHAVFVPDYDISLAKSLVAGSDIWLNTPELGKEASGTSGMKAAANGVLNMTTLGGWAKEVNWGDAGWVLDAFNLADSIYTILEKEVIPLYYDRTEAYPQKWVDMMRKSILIAKKFGAERMLFEYMKYLYS